MADIQYQQISIRLPVELLNRLETLSDNAGMSRNSTISLVLTSGVGMIEALVNPGETFNNPEVASMLIQAMEKVTEHDKAR